ncbi:hypothetical protein ACFVYE_42415 [Streptomyces sp. NPDC058239]|uniref:hypothetical protein n=1 Tax=Streptomyces sp. NPDC058239 TaxID=3346395 RepID=UPI0036E7FF7B
MTSTEAETAALRAAAEAGDADAARELGRLLCLVPFDVTEEPKEFSDFEPTWPAEQWLRTALDAQPDDALAAVLLAGLLIVQIDHWQLRVGADPEADEDEIEEANTRRTAEAEELHTRVARHAHGAAAGTLRRTALAGRAALAELSAEDGRQTAADYACYVVELDWWSGSVNSTERLVVADPEELRWACDKWLGALYGDGPIPADSLTLTVYEPGEEPKQVDLSAHFDKTVGRSKAFPRPVGRS